MALNQAVEAGEALLGELDSSHADFEEEPSLLEVASQGPALFHDAANGQSFFRAPYLPATVNGPMYPRSGPQSGAAKAWLEKAAQPAWSALPFGPRTPSQVYVLPFDHMREVQDEFSWNYDHNAPAAPPQFAFAAPIFLEQSSEQHATTQAETEAEEEMEKPVEYVQAIEVDDLESSLLETSSQDGPRQLIPDDFWSSRGAAPGFHSYISPYYDLVNPTLPGSFADYRFAPRPAMRSVGQTGWFDRVRTGFVADATIAHPYAYHQGALPPFAHEIEPFKSMSQTAPSVAAVGENEPETFLSSFVESEAATEEETEGCVNCQFN